MWKNASLAAKLIVVIVSATALIFVGVLMYDYQTSKKTVLSEMGDNVKNLTLKTVYQIEATLNSIEKVPECLANYLECECQQPETLEPFLKALLAQNPAIYGMAAAFEPYSFKPQRYYYCPYIHRSDSGLVITHLGSENYRYWLWDWYTLPKELGRAMWSEPYYDEGGGNIIMTTYSAPMYRTVNNHKKFGGVITADISLFWLEEIIARVKILQSGYAFLLSRNGDFITHPQERLIMRESIFSVAEARGDAQLRELGRKMVQGSEGYACITDFASGKRSVLYYAPLPSNGWSLGIILPEDELFAGLRQMSLKLALIGFGGLVLLILLIIIISRTITRPLRTLATTTEAIGQGDFAVTVAETGPREILHLAQAFNRLGRQLIEYIEKRDFIRDTFGRYVTQEVVSKLMESRNGLELGGEDRELTILMSDLRGFTALTAEMSPRRVVIFLNRYLAKMIEILMDHRGVIDEIIGDGILAFFGAPQPMEDHPFQAVACALQMQAAMAEINALNEAEGFPRLEMGIAVNTGDVVVGNIGSERRTKYSIVGAQVNFTARMESYTVGGQVLISPSTLARLKDQVEVRKSFQVEMKGVPKPVTLYDIRAVHGPIEVVLPDLAEDLKPLPQPQPARLHRIKDKIITDTIDRVWITDLSNQEAVATFSGVLKEWDDVRLHLLDETGGESAGKIFAKVIVLKLSQGQGEAKIRFTSVSPEAQTFLEKLLKKDFSPHN
ncbi:PDC sensor domain-containing protein [Desulfobacca acetoxidans]|uniref:Adenylate/guanylate cyclase with integral membrane sensor n=1 Tax=Desulfobacca acetoxidans (strain ATCC 700848 / DSM 11109 / ASRB2) TaxID=880072 RepID=F2NEU2_DESAR|nr:adenylate/guanylate cyclase domain-containing protein [Desulfobacca acetoxidans]AEB08282.1 adenylate/guanylate cyclase with integral membrane sensor [Desulfobacca acetoxidans DSM 11109]